MMRLTKSYLAITSLLLAGLLQVQTAVAAGEAAGTVGTPGNNGTVTSPAPSGTTNRSFDVPPAGTTNNNNGVKQPSQFEPTNQLVDPARKDMSLPADPRKTGGHPNNITPGNNCYTIDGQPTTATDCSPTNPNVK
jgi:hypothetical protein